MFTKFKATTLAVSLACLGLGATGAFADPGDDDFKTVIHDNMTRRAPGSTSGSGHTVEANCPQDPSGNAWQGATATLKIQQGGSASIAKVRLRGGAPDTVYTVWMRTAGNGPDGSAIGPSPLTGGGATPFAAGTSLDAMLSYTPPFAGTATPVNGFTTDSNGNANFTISLDFPVVGGAYPFQEASAQAVADWQAAGGNPAAQRKPTPVVNPADPNISAPFLLRVISHCTDGLGHGLSPATREAWFDYP